MGQVDQINNWYKISDIFVFPSKQEGFGQVLLEAMACGLPSVVFANVKGYTQLPFEEFIINGRIFFGRMI